MQILLGLVVATFGTSANAQLSVCNKAAREAVVALGRFDGHDWLSEGWWTIAPRHCARLIGTRLDARYYYLYARDDVSGTWEGGTAFCTAPRKFSIVGRRDCATRGFDSTGFFQIDTGQAPDWTQVLSD